MMKDSYIEDVVLAVFSLSLFSLVFVALYQKFIPEWGLTIYLLLFFFSGMYIWSGQLYQDLNKKFGNKK